MDKELKEFLNRKFKSTALIVDSHEVKVTAPDGEEFAVLSDIGKYLNDETKTYYLRCMEAIFDTCFCEDKELMSNNIWREFFKNGVPFIGMSSGNRQGERVRIGKRIRSIRESRGIEARDLARLAGIDAANLSRIELGKYSVGLDILSKIAAALGMKIDLVEL